MRGAVRTQAQNWLVASLFLVTESLKELISSLQSGRLEEIIRARIKV